MPLGADPSESGSEPRSEPRSEARSEARSELPTEGEPALVCATCGALPVDPALARLTWARGVESGRDVWTCETCSRRHLRSIEGKLDSSWW